MSSSTKSLVEQSMKKDLTEIESKEVSRLLMVEAVAKPEKSTILNHMDRYDWNRVTYADPRDPRVTEAPCLGAHRVEKFGKGSLSGTNKWGVWLTCSECRLRLLYCPTMGSKGTFRSAGPLPKDVSEKLQEKAEGKEVTKDDLRTQALGLSGAETSALRRLEEIRKEKTKMAEAKTAAKAAAKAAASAENPMSKKTVKRDHPLTAEVQEWIDVTKDD